MKKESMISFTINKAPPLPSHFTPRGTTKCEQIGAVGTARMEGCWG